MGRNYKNPNIREHVKGDTIKAETAVWVLTCLIVIVVIGFGVVTWNTNTHIDNLGSQLNERMDVLSEQITSMNQSLVKLYNGDLSSDMINQVAKSVVVVISIPVK